MLRCVAEFVVFLILSALQFAFAEERANTTAPSRAMLPEHASAPTKFRRVHFIIVCLI